MTICLMFDQYGDGVRVLGSRSASVMDFEPIGHFHPDWTAIDATIASMRQLLTTGSHNGRLSVGDCETLRRLGMWLFDELIPFQIRDWFSVAAGNTLTISIPDTLDHIPWECLHSGHGFIGSRFAMSRLLQKHHTVIGSQDREQLTVRTLESALVIADPADGLDAAYTEGMSVRDQIDAYDSIRVDLRAVSVDPEFLVRNLRQRSVLHFAGHIDELGWEMDGEYLTQDHLLRLTGSHAMPSLVFANGCRAAGTEAGEQPLLHAWLASGILHFLGPQERVPDRLARLFSLGFYERLLRGVPIAESVRQTRVQLAEEYGEGTLPWGSYVLYGPPETVYEVEDAEQHSEIAQRRRERLARSAATSLERRPGFTGVPEPVRSGRSVRRSSPLWSFERFIIVLLLVILILVLATLRISKSEAMQPANFDFEVSAESSE